MENKSKDGSVKRTGGLSQDSGSVSKARPTLSKTTDEDMVSRYAALNSSIQQKTAPPEASTFVIRTAGPLTDTTRRIRKPLLLLCLIGVLMIKTGLIPERVTALGIEFTKTNQGTILLITGASLAYFLVGFVICVTCDLLVWLHALEASHWAVFPITGNLFLSKSLASKGVAFARFIYEVLVPLLLGSYSTKLLWRPGIQALSHFF
jgi:hypothetical protein